MRRVAWCFDAASCPSRANSAAEQYAGRGTGTPRAFALSHRTVTVRESSRSARRMVHLKINCAVCFAHVPGSASQASLPRTPLYRRRPELTSTTREPISPTTVAEGTRIPRRCPLAAHFGAILFDGQPQNSKRFAAAPLWCSTMFQDTARLAPRHGRTALRNHGRPRFPRAAGPI